MVAFDMKTVMLANIIIDFVGMVVMCMLWYQNHDKYSGIAYWVLDWILLTGGMALIALQGIYPAVGVDDIEQQYDCRRYGCRFILA